MTTWTIADDHARLLADGRPTFLLADTVWAAFTRPSMSEWVDYLHLRRRQGFNAVNISVLPIAHDRSIGADDRAPFELAADGSWQLDRPAPGYFQRAARMCAAAVAEGLTPVLVVLWCNYLPGTWAAKLTPELVFTPTDRDRYVRLVADTFADCQPIFVVSGDDGFDDPDGAPTQSSTPGYLAATRILRDRAPGCLITAHSNPAATLPPALANDGVDFYAFQSGHGRHEWHDRAWQLAEQYLAEPIRRPIVDLEPCYEGLAAGEGALRYTAAQVRRASWTAVLAGAGAGVGYAAHGLWSWHRRGDAFAGEGFSGTPFPAAEALRFPGAAQMGTLRRLVERFDLYGLHARQDLLVDDRSGIRVGGSADGRTLAAYLPHPFAVTLAEDWTAARVHCWDLAHDRPDYVRVARTAPSDRADAPAGTVVSQPEFLGDTLVVFQR